MELNPLELRPLGSTGMEVSVLGLGTVKIGRDQQVKYPRGFTIPDDGAVRDLIALSRDLGINMIDTAPAYGTSEERLGKLLPNSNDWIIVTKVGEAFEKGQSSFDFSAKGTRTSIERSLKRLKRDTLDVVLVHSDGNDMHIIENEGVLPELARMKEEGLIRAFGMSTKTIEGGMWCVQNADIVMATCNLADNQDMPIIAEAHRLNKGVLVKKGLQSGHAENSVEDALRHVFSTAGVSSMVIGTINPNHLRQNVELTRKVCTELAE